MSSEKIRLKTKELDPYFKMVKAIQTDEDYETPCRCKKEIDLYEILSDWEKSHEE